jgi:hypothetical protein
LKQNKKTKSRCSIRLIKTSVKWSILKAARRKKTYYAQRRKDKIIAKVFGKQASKKTMKGNL